MIIEGIVKNKKKVKEPPLAMWEQCVCEIRAEIRCHDGMKYAISLCDALENSMVEFAKTEQKEEHKCETCKYVNCGFKDFNTKNECDRWEAEPKAEKHYRPFRDTDELIKVWFEKDKRGITNDALEMPLIWVRSKFNKDHKGVFINNYFGEYVLMNNQQCFLSRLFNEYTFLDGSVCGVEE